jgi:hypothetical protein
MSIAKEPTQQREQQSLSQALLLSPRGLSLQGISIPGQQSRASVGLEDHRRASLLSLIELALDITSDGVDSIRDNNASATSPFGSKSNGEDSFRKQ